MSSNQRQLYQDLLTSQLGRPVEAFTPGGHVAARHASMPWRPCRHVVALILVQIETPRQPVAETPVILLGTICRPGCAPTYPTSPIWPLPGNSAGLLTHKHTAIPTGNSSVDCSLARRPMGNRDKIDIQSAHTGGMSTDCRATRDGRGASPPAPKHKHPVVSWAEPEYDHAKRIVEVGRA